MLKGLRGCKGWGWEVRLGSWVVGRPIAEFLENGTWEAGGLGSWEAVRLGSWEARRLGGPSPFFSEIGIG